MNRFSQRMNRVSVAVKVLLRPAFAALLAISQVTSRHPIYTSMYLICTGMALAFFAWLWFVVLLAFAPLW